MRGLKSKANVISESWIRRIVLVTHLTHRWAVEKVEYTITYEEINSHDFTCVHGEV